MCGVSTVLKALDEACSVVGGSVTTFQALSGRGDAKYDPDLSLATSIRCATRSSGPMSTSAKS
jgi:aspartate-semialdehyde dehydrogenase